MPQPGLFGAGNHRFRQAWRLHEVLIPVGCTAAGADLLDHFLVALEVVDDGDVHDHQPLHPVGNGQCDFLGDDAAPVVAHQLKLINTELVQQADHILCHFLLAVVFDVRAAFTVAQPSQVGGDDVKTRLQIRCHVLPAVGALRPAVDHHQRLATGCPAFSPGEASPGRLSLFWFRQVHGWAP